MGEHYGLIEGANVPVIFFDDVGDMVVKHDRIWYPLFIQKPSSIMTGEFENEMVAWASGPLRTAQTIIARAIRVIRPHRPHVTVDAWQRKLILPHQ